MSNFSRLSSETAQTVAKTVEPSQLPKPRTDVVFKELSEGAVLFSTGNEIYFGLNTVGAEVWKLLPPATKSLDEMCAVLAAKYTDVDPKVIREDVIELLTDLVRSELAIPAE